jgi:small subunit ribosomal protein S21
LAALNPHLSRRWCRNVLYAWEDATPVRRKIQAAARKPSWSNSAASANAPVATGKVNPAKESEQSLIEVKLRKQEPVDKALRRLKKQMVREGVFKELKLRRHYEKPSVSLRKKTKAARFEAMLKQRHADD